MSAVKGSGPGDSKRLDDELDRARRGETNVIGGIGQQMTPRTGVVRQQQIVRNKPVKQTTIIDARTKPPMLKEGEQGQRPILLPVRTVVYVEVGGMDDIQVGELCRQYAATYQGNVHGPHYMIPVREGRLRTEVEFEGEFLQTVLECCEIKDGKIVMKGDAVNVQVMRTHVGMEE